MSRASVGTALTLAILAGCDSGGTEPAKTRSVQAGNPHVDQLKALTEMNRGLALRRAIQDSGSKCKRVEASGYQQDYKNMSMWTARCSDTKDWALFIAPNGDVQVRMCEHARQLGLPECKIPGG